MQFLLLHKIYNIIMTFVYMEKREVADWICQPKITMILISFSVPRTPKQVEKRVNIKKLKLRPFLEKHLLKSLNPSARKGRFYILTNEARRLLELPGSKKETDKDWDLIGWVMASPRQRIVVLKAVDSVKRPSEEIRERASRLNSCLSRISTKGILKELISGNLIESEMIERKRYYWISKKGKSVVNDIMSVF